jgi:glycosyltransferase involved in cell wall biosynthesis
MSRQPAQVPWRHRLRRGALTAISGLQPVRMRVERSTIAARGTRVLAIASYNFPVYSHTFVYQELAQMLAAGFKVRLAFSAMSKDPIASQYRGVWRSRRRLVVDDRSADRAVARYEERMPSRVNELVQVLSEASGMDESMIRKDRHFRQAFTFTRLVESYRPDYLHSYFFYEGSLFALVASFLLQIPRGMTCYADHMLDDYHLKVVALHMRQCDLVVATSHRIKQELTGFMPEAASKILVKPNGVNTARFPAQERLASKPDELPSVVSVSRLDPKKGLLELVEAAGLLRDRDQAVRLCIIGAADPAPSSRNYAEALQARVKELGLDDLVHLVGRKSESQINDYFRRSDVFVAPYVETPTGDKDGIPTALLEAMSAGLAIVATDAGSIREVIEDGVDGVIVGQGDSIGLANAIAFLVGDADARREMGLRAARKARATLEASVIGRELHERMRAVSNGSPR